MVKKYEDNFHECEEKQNEIKDLHNKLNDEAYVYLEKLEADILNFRKDVWDTDKAENAVGMYERFTKASMKAVKTNPDCKGDGPYGAFISGGKHSGLKEWLELDGNDERMWSLNRNETILINEVLCHEEFQSQHTRITKSIREQIDRTDRQYKAYQEMERTSNHYEKMCLDPTLEEYEDVMHKIEDLDIPVISWLADVFDWFYDTEKDDRECAEKTAEFKKAAEDNRKNIIPSFKDRVGAVTQRVLRRDWTMSYKHTRTRTLDWRVARCNGKCDKLGLVQCAG